MVADLHTVKRPLALPGLEVIAWALMPRLPQLLPEIRETRSVRLETAGEEAGEAAGFGVGEMEVERVAEGQVFQDLAVRDFLGHLS